MIVKSGYIYKDNPVIVKRKMVICDNQKCGQGNDIAPNGRAVITFAGITPDIFVYKNLKERGWRVIDTGTGAKETLCPNCGYNKKKRK